jgi:hypothetical protein
MVYTIIAEGRSGGQTLTEWFKLSLPNFIVAHEPFNCDNFNFTKNTNKTDFTWVDKNKNYFVKELFSEDILPLLSISDKVMCLYRENWEEQIKSLLYAMKTNKWHIKYTEDNVKKLVSDDDVINFYNSGFKEKKEAFQSFIVKNNLISISYEQLYYDNGIEKIKEHFNINSNINFPLGQKYLTKENILI